jgi:hypothetical protein
MNRQVNHFQLKHTFFPCPTPTTEDEKYGMFTSALREIFPAAMVTAGEDNPQDTPEDYFRKGDPRNSPVAERRQSPA